MSAKKLQKMFYFSDEHAKSFIECRIDDIAEKEQRSSSYVIENLLLDGLLPENEEARELVYNNLYPYTCVNGGIQKTLLCIFYGCAAEAGWNERYADIEPIIAFCLQICERDAHCTGKEKLLYHFRSQLDSIISRIANCKDSCIEVYERNEIRLQEEWGKHLLDIAEKTPSKVNFHDHFQFVFDCWEMLYDWSYTYRYLSDLANLYNWPENAYTRNKLYDIISSISKKWRAF